MKQYWQRANYLPVRPLGKDGRLVTGGPGHCALAQRIAEEGVVLAKNEGVLPLPHGAKLAVFGKAQTDMVKVGTGSGAVRTAFEKTVLDGLRELEAEGDLTVRIFEQSNFTDLDAFKARGGKIIMSTGWEDQTVPPAPIIDYYERVCAHDGGIEKTKEYFRLFCIPGCAHGGGKGRAMTGTPSGSAARRLLMVWREKGRPPERLDSSWKSKKLDMPIAVYPGLYVKDSAGKWQVKQMRRGVPRIDDIGLKTEINVR